MRASKSYRSTLLKVQYCKKKKREQAEGHKYGGIVFKIVNGLVDEIRREPTTGSGGGAGWRGRFVLGLLVRWWDRRPYADASKEAMKNLSVCQVALAMNTMDVRQCMTTTGTPLTLNTSFYLELIRLSGDR